MVIEYLNEFVVLAEEGKFSEAAEKLYTTSSSLSKHIHSLEDELGVSLFERSKKGAALNLYGEAMLPYAKEIVRLRKEAQGKIESQKMHEGGILRINSNYRVFEEAIEFRREYGIDLLINEDFNSKELLRKGFCELAFIIDQDKDDDEIAFIPYKKDRLILVCSVTHPLSKREEVDIAELEEESFVMFPGVRAPISRLTSLAFERAGYRPKVALTATVGSTITRLVAQNMGIALLWEKALRPIMTDDIAVVRLKPLYEAEIDLCYMKNAALSRNAADFIAFIEGKKDLA